jgi:hypothetical protein
MKEASYEGEITTPSLKKAKTSSRKEVTAEVEGPTLSKEMSVAPSPSRRSQ